MYNELYKRDVYKRLDRILQPSDLFDSILFRVAGAMTLQQMAIIRTQKSSVTGIQQTIHCTKKEVAFYKAIRQVLWELQSIFSLCDKMQFFFQLKLTDQISDDSWLFYSQSEVHALHVEMRSIYDSIAKLLDSIAIKSGVISTSFHENYKSCSKKRAHMEALLGDEITRAILQCFWFLDLRDVRDSIVHYGNDATVRHLQPDSIIFNVKIQKQRNSPIIHFPEFMFRDWIYYSPYIGFQIGMLIDLLNRIAWVAKERLNLKFTNPPAKFTLKHSDAALQTVKNSHSNLHQGLYPQSLFASRFPF